MLGVLKPRRHAIGSMRMRPSIARFDRSAAGHVERQSEFGGGSVMIAVKLPFGEATSSR